jgi:hypothetical protein
MKLFLFVFYIVLILCIILKNFGTNQMYNLIYKRFISDNFFREENMNCDKYDPIYLMGERFKKKPVTICENEESNHICFQSSKYNDYNKISRIKYGVICKIKNFILDPLKSKQTNYIYKGPVDKATRGAPILSKGFFNMNCSIKKNFRGNKIYKNYFKAWNYNYENKDENIEELSPGKTIFMISRNQDSPNIFHGLSEIINTISIMYFFNLKPEDIQILFLESMKLQNDPFYMIYENMISKGGKPIYIKNLKKKYHIESAIHVPINWDSPLFIDLKIPNGYPNCKYSTQTYNIFNDLINKYLKIPNFKDSFISDNKIFYYPKTVIQNYKSNNPFNKTITIQWRKVWPEGRQFQKRILGNGPELADKLSSILPKNYLIRLIDTASLSIIDQIAIMRKTDYLIGVHGAGISLSIFMPSHSILHEILPKKNIKVLVLMSALSGHKIYSDIIKSDLKLINNNDIYFFDKDEFAEKALKHIKNNFF